jgi:hypothetical protein
MGPIECFASFQQAHRSKEVERNDMILITILSSLPSKPQYSIIAPITRTSVEMAANHWVFVSADKTDILEAQNRDREMAGKIALLRELIVGIPLGAFLLLMLFASLMALLYRIKDGRW